MTFGFIEAEKASFPISRMCCVFGVSQSGFFAWQTRAQAENAVARYIDGFYNRYQAAFIARLPEPHRLRANGKGSELNALH